MTPALRELLADWHAKAQREDESANDGRCAGCYTECADELEAALAASEPRPEPSSSPPESVRSPREEESFREPIPLYARAAAPPEDRWNYDTGPPIAEWVEGWITTDRNPRGWWTPVFFSAQCGLQWRFDRLDFEPGWNLVAWRRVSSPLPPPPAGLAQEGE